MNILFNLPPAEGWARAANYLGYSGFVLGDKPFDSFNIAKPDLIITFDDSERVFQKCLKKFPTKLIKITSYLPASDCPLEFGGGSIKDQYKCDAVIIGSYKPEYSKYIIALSNSNINFKIFGSGNWNIPQYLGYIPPTEIADAYASAKWSLDLEKEPNRVLAINSAGGNALSAGKWNSGVIHLDQCNSFTDDPVSFIEKIKSDPIKIKEKVPTLSDRLKEILEVNDVYLHSS